VERPPAWMMRQAGRYMASYRKLVETFPSFRERSETTDLIVKISLQPWEAFRPDGVILFSDILTPLPAIGIPFDIDETKGPLLDTPIESEEGLQALHKIDLDKVHFVGESLSILRNEVCHLVPSLFNHAGFFVICWSCLWYKEIGHRGYKACHKIIKSQKSAYSITLTHGLHSVGAESTSFSSLYSWTYLL
jgi:uroporphyrinogen-III decarboxylase